MNHIKFQGQDVIELVDGDSRALFAPQHGGRLLNWEVGGRSIIHWPENPDWSNVKNVRGGNPLLFPFIARHMVDGVVGKWRKGGRTFDLPMHGYARQTLFTIDEKRCSDNKIVMVLESNEQTRPGYPYEFRFTAVYELSGRSLCCEVRVENTSAAGSEPMPYYFGHHWYFSVPHHQRNRWKVEIDRDGSVRQDDNGNIYPVADFAELSLGDESINNAMHLLKSQRVLRLGGDHVVEIELDHPGSVPWYAVTLWTETPHSDFYCIEPWQGLPNAIHHGQGLRMLAPGQSERGICLLRVQ